MDNEQVGSLFNAVPKLERKGLRDEVYERILNLLLSKQLDSGARLSIDVLARELEVSPTPVREALARLESTHLVTREALKGYRVAPPLNAREIHELAEARKMLEITALKLALSQKATLLQMLEEAQQTHSSICTKILQHHEDVLLELTREYFSADMEFHMRILIAANNTYILQMYDTLGALTHRMRQAASYGPDDIREAHCEHLAFLTALRSGSNEESITALEQHLHNVKTRSIRDLD